MTRKKLNIVSGLCLFVLWALPVNGQTPRPVYDVRVFGAKGDGHTLDTTAIQKAIDACSAAGGGMVYVPPGIYKAGTLCLRDNLTLYLEGGAVLLQSKDMNDYIKPDKECFVNITGSRYVFLHGDRVRRVTITGGGTINGNLALNPGGGRGPLPILFENSKDILLENITVVDSPGWCITVYGCQRVSFVRINCLNSFADGINPVCSQDVLYDGVLIENSGDDAITIKNETMAQAGPPCGFLSQNIIIANTIVRNTGHPAIKFGTGTAGVFRNILVNNCIFENTGAMFTIQLMRPDIPGVPDRLIENVTYSNIVLRNCLQMFDITSMDVLHPVISNLSIDNVVAEDLKASSRIHGLPEAPIRGVNLSNIRVTDSGWKLTHWLNMRWVQDVRMDTVRLNLTDKTDSALVFADSGDFEIRGLNITGLSNRAAAIQLERVNGFAIYDSAAPAVDRFVEVLGPGTFNLSFTGMDFRRTKTPLAAGEGLGAEDAFPVSSRIRFSELSVSEQIKPNERFQVKAKLTNEGVSGFVRAQINVNGMDDVAKWLWLEQDESRLVELETSRYYEPRDYRVSFGPLSAVARVQSAPAAFAYGEQMEIVAPEAAGEWTRVTVPIKNIGGATGDKEVVLYANDQAVASQTVTLKPGEEKQVVVEHRFAEKGPRLLRVGDWPAWPFATFANVETRFAQTRDRIIIDAAGDQRGPLYCNGPCAVMYVPDVEGDFVATMHLLGHSATSPKGAVGLVVRNDLTRQGAESPGLGLLYIEKKYGGNQMFQTDLDGDGMVDMTLYGGATYTSWYRLVKQGSDFSGYVSWDGQLWNINKSGGVPNEYVKGGLCTMRSAAEVQDVGVFTFAHSATNQPARAELEHWCLTRPIPLEKLAFSDLTVSRTDVGLNEDFKVRAVVSNRCDQAGLAKAAFLFDGHEILTRWPELKPGESAEIAYSVSPKMIRDNLRLVERDPQYIYGTHRITVGSFSEEAAIHVLPEK